MREIFIIKHIQINRDIYISCINKNIHLNTQIRGVSVHCKYNKPRESAKRLIVYCFNVFINQ